MTTFAQPFQDYEILDRVGAGAMGTVFKARHKRLNRIVALKVLKPSLARDKRYVERLRREARIVASLSHPNIVTGYDLGEEAGYHFFVMEFVEGKSLRALLVEWGMFAEEYVLRVARQVAEALDHAYQRGVIHRDIKPGNILIDDAGNVKLTDMGLAKGPADLTLTRDGATVGTPQYIAPEQARNPQDVDVRSDLYSLGATLYHMATGMPPFRGDTMAELITNVLHENPVPPDEANSAVSAGVSLVIRKLLAKNLQVRYQTPRELLDDLDRIAKSEAPAVDAGRLAHDEFEPAPWLKRSLLVAGAGALIVLAWWFGAQMRADAPREPPAEQFLAALDAELQALPTPGARLSRLGTVTAPPSGSVFALEQRRKQVDDELQRAVDAVVEELGVAEWPRLSAWFVDPTVWPDRARFERELLAPRLRAVAGITLGQLPARVRLSRVDELLRSVDAALSQRDAAVETRFASFLGTTLPARADGRLRTGDFAGAERLWRDALPTFFDGVQRPLPEQLPDDLRRTMRERYLPALRAATEAIDRAERNVAGALQAEVDAVLATFGERLVGGADPEVVEEALQRFRHDLGQLWPPPVQFRVAGDPWPEVERRLTALQQQLDLASAARQGERCERRCDLAWRALCVGTAAEALRIVEHVEPATAAQERALALHRRALAAARDVEQALVIAVGSAEPAPFAFPLVGPPDAIELSVQRQGDRLQLVGQAIGQPPRQVRLTELRLGDLLLPGSLGGAPAVRDVPADLRALGVAVLRLVADDLGGRDDHVAGLPAAERSFLLDDAWPRILRVRDARGEQPLDRSELFVMLERALADFDRHGSRTELEKAILACSKAAPQEQSAQQARLLRRASQRLELARRQADLTAELLRSAPSGADVDVRAGDGGLTVEVALPAAVLQRDAGEGWRLRDDLLEFAAGGRPWKDLPRLSLRGGCGIDPGPAETHLSCELSLPSAVVGCRFYLVQFRGIACALVVTADDRVQAELVSGDPLREDRAQPAFERALAAALVGDAERRALVVPGALHRLTIDVVVTAARTQARVRVGFEGVQLLDELHDVDPAAPPTFAVLPQQELAVRRIAVRAVGL